MRRSAARAAVLACAVLVAGCGEDRTESTVTQTEPLPPRPAAGAPPQPQQQQAPPARVALTETEYRLDPARIRVDRPARIAIATRNRGRRPHALVVVTPHGERRTRTLGPGASTTLTVDLDTPGRYRWYCPVGDHDERGMRGSIAVAEG